MHATHLLEVDDNAPIPEPERRQTRLYIPVLIVRQRAMPQPAWPSEEQSYDVCKNKQHPIYVCLPAWLGAESLSEDDDSLPDCCTLN
jgi:hypothetical protein